MCYCYGLIHYYWIVLISFIFVFQKLSTAHKKKFSIKKIQIRWKHLLKKSLMGNSIFVLYRARGYYPRELGSKAQGGSKLDPILRLSVVDWMSIRNSWGIDDWKLIVSSCRVFSLKAGKSCSRKRILMFLNTFTKIKSYILTIWCETG